VLAMGTYALADLMTTKPYVSGAAYIQRMSDYCRGCRFDPKQDCPITPLYWAFLARHQQRLAENQRLIVPLRAPPTPRGPPRTRRTGVPNRERAPHSGASPHAGRCAAALTVPEG